MYILFLYLTFLINLDGLKWMDIQPNDMINGRMGNNENIEMIEFCSLVQTYRN